jgi:hypothetical protein
MKCFESKPRCLFVEVRGRINTVLYKGDQIIANITTEETPFQEDSKHNTQYTREKVVNLQVRYFTGARVL